MERIAFYGKGGIGKSTIAANVSALLAKKGMKVLHIGCDPKADSARILQSGRIPSVLELLEEKESLFRAEIIHTGKNGVQCVECGGPEAGCGCAGLGITTAMEEMEKLGVFQENWDVIVYDVLGDVVCGGFSVPMRKHYADKVFVVTSADYMSLYAANNILKGILRYSREENMFGGLILNHIKNSRDREIAEAFSYETKAEICVSLIESREMQLADFRGMPFTELFPETENTRALEKFAGALMKKTNGMQLPQPMTAEDLERFGKEIYEKGNGKDEGIFC